MSLINRCMIYVYTDPDCGRCTFISPNFLFNFLKFSVRQMFQDTQREVVGGSTHEGSQLLEGLRQLGYTYCNLDAGQDMAQLGQ